MPKSPYGGFEDETEIKVVRHEVQDPEYVFLGEAPTLPVIVKNEPIENANSINAYPAYSSYGEHIALPKYRPVRYRAEKQAIQEWVTTNCWVSFEDSATLYVYGHYRYYVAWIWKKEE